MLPTTMTPSLSNDEPEKRPIFGLILRTVSVFWLEFAVAWQFERFEDRPITDIEKRWRMAYGSSNF
jgi:hypothetical protein